jgi:hypothetical protein
MICIKKKKYNIIHGMKNYPTGGTSIMMSNTYFAVRYMSSAQDRDYLVYARTYYNLNITLQITIHTRV